MNSPSIQKGTQPSEAPEPFAGHDAGRWMPVPAKVVASWPVGSFAENVAVNADGLVFVSLHSHNRIERYDPRSGRTATFAELPAPATGLAFGADGALWVTGGAVGKPPGYVWRVDPSGAWHTWIEIADAVFMNGCTPHPDGTSLLACESITGRILRVSLDKPRWRAWITDDRLRPHNPQMPGANGIKVRDRDVWISVTDSNLILRAAVGDDAAAGLLQVAAENLRADDFAFGQSGALYIATHPAHSVLRLAADGSRTTIAGPAEGAVGSTACAFGRAAGDENAVYVTTSGGLWTPYHGEVQEAKLLRLEVGEAGQPLHRG
jgi:sugar lactone lactonase YvrE